MGKREKRRGSHFFISSCLFWTVLLSYINPNLRQAQRGSSDKLVVCSQWDK